MTSQQTKPAPRQTVAGVRSRGAGKDGPGRRFLAWTLCLTSWSAAFCRAAETPKPAYDVQRRNITVDGLLGDWEGVPVNVVKGEGHLWFGQGMTRDQWRGNADLSYSWRAAWHGDRLFFLFEVADDQVVEPNQPSSFLCDCVEIYLDPNNRGGRRVEVLDRRANWFDKCDPKELMGYELHFLPTLPPTVYVDHADRYAFDKPQTDRFKKGWSGEAAARRTPHGYLLEIGLSVPGLTLRPGLKLGAEAGVCDDDGQGRESIMMWTGTKADFWITMEDYGKVTLVGEEGSGVRRNDAALFGRLQGGAEVSVVRGSDGQFGLAVAGAGQASAGQDKPIQLELFDSDGQVSRLQAGYDRLDREGRGLTGRGQIKIREAAVQVEDRWTCDGHVLAVDRTLKVRGSDAGGFLSAVLLDLAQRQTWPEVQCLVPGMIYGGFENLTETAIGGRAHYRLGQFDVRIREDRLPAPLVAARFKDRTSLAVLNPRPAGATTAADAADVTAAKPLVDRRFAFGALGASESARGLTLGYWYPGTEGQVTYRGDTYPGGQLHAWRRRYHPLEDGLTQCYRVEFRFAREESATDWRRESWRWAWQRLAPKVTPHDIETVRRSLADMLAAQVLTVGGRSGLPSFINAMDRRQVDRRAILGFCGANLDAATAMLYEADRDSSPRGARLRRLAITIIDSFLRLRMAPPQGEGFLIDSGQAVTALSHAGNKQMYLRSFADDVKRLLVAYQREKRAGRDHPAWLAWCRQFADWLLTQQRPDGSFPRSWHQDTGKVHDSAGQGSYNAIPTLVLLSRITGETEYLQAALRAGQFCWTSGQNQGIFVGGTIDNPNVIDKEAGTLSLEAYLALLEATSDRVWLDRAKTAGDYGETWIYVWNVPMSRDADAEALHWKPNVPTVGVQLIATGHSLVDCFMTYNPVHYAKLAKYAGDEHYRDVARILLHNTKNMLAISGRTFDLPGPGWQQEHWSLAPRRGLGLHRGWLPWVSTSHLNGIQALEEYDAALLK